MTGGAVQAARATSYDVARAAGVAQSTVSRCFRGDSNISPATRSKVLEVAQRLGYMPNALARGLITRRSNMVGVIATRYTLRGNPDVITAIGEALSAAGKQLMLVTAASDAPSAADLRSLLEYPLDGVISCLAMRDVEIMQFRQRGIPVVLYNRRPQSLVVDQVITDHFAAGGVVASTLHEAGHRHFLCVTGPRDAPVSRERVEGFLSRLATLGIARPVLIETDYTYTGGRERFLAFARAGALPDAVFCTSDQVAMGVMDACRFDLGLTIPRALSVIGFDDIAEAARPTYDLTTMRQDSVQMARQAVALLLSRLDDPGADARSLIVEATFIPRTSARLSAILK